MAGNEISLIDKVGRPDRSLAESQVRNRYAARLLGVVSKVCLSIKVGRVTDDLNGVFVSAYSTVCAQTPELAGCCSGRSGIKLIVSVKRKVCNVIVDTDRETSLVRILP